MIIVTGTKRSGTSMWMHVLVAAGLPCIGERFPEGWGELLRHANPDGFFESELIAGINYQTNPHPLTGAWLAPQLTRRHAVKVLIPGLIRSDIAFVDRCLATVRSWRAFVASTARVREMAGAQATPSLGDSMLPPALEWWCSNYGLIRDIAIRGYPAHVLSYDGFLRDPERHTAEVLHWIGGANDPERAARVVDPLLRTQHEPHAPDVELAEGLSPRHVQTFDDLYDTIDSERPLSGSLIAELNRTDDALRPLVLDHHARINADTVAQLLPHT